MRQCRTSSKALCRARSPLSPLSAVSCSFTGLYNTKESNHGKPVYKKARQKRRIEENIQRRTVRPKPGKVLSEKQFASFCVRGGSPWQRDGTDLLLGRALGPRWSSVAVFLFSALRLRTSRSAVSDCILFLGDGPSFNGWWFGPKVGGDQVWAYNGGNLGRENVMPPTSFWKAGRAEGAEGAEGAETETLSIR